MVKFGFPELLGDLIGHKRESWLPRGLEEDSGENAAVTRIDPNEVRNMVLLTATGQATLVQASRNEVAYRMGITQRDFRLVDPWVSPPFT